MGNHPKARAVPPPPHQQQEREWETLCPHGPWTILPREAQAEMGCVLQVMEDKRGLPTAGHVHAFSGRSVGAARWKARKG